MLNLIPSVKTLEIKSGFIDKSAIHFNNSNCDKRIVSALKNLPFDENGIELKITIGNGDGESYEINIEKDRITVNADSAAGAFYAVQTLRQIFKHSEIPLLYIKDRPDFKYRGFYHDITRGKVPTVKTLKSLIDNMAYYKLNSLQLYVEHTYEFKEYAKVNEKFGYLTSNELKELDAYCKENFIDFIPSLSTFGHLFELLSQGEFKHLRVLKNFNDPNFWDARMQHHTIDPLNPKSIEVIKSLIDQYIPNFESEFFNICCDETFDLKEYEKSGEDVGKIYIDFVKKIITYIKEKGKTPMMWADILLQHPEAIDDLPNDVYFLNWDYSKEPSEAKIKQFAEIGKNQIVCPGTSSWSRLCENFENEEKNISLTAEYGYKYNALGVLNTNWGDWANPCSLELAMYGLVLGAEKSWSVNTKINDDFYNKINFILYGNHNGIKYLKALSKINDYISWNDFASNYFRRCYHTKDDMRKSLWGDIADVQSAYTDFCNEINSTDWKDSEYCQEMLLSAEGVCVIAELSEQLSGKKITRITDTDKWLQKYRAKWLAKNKPSELFRIEEMFKYIEECSK